MVVISQKILWNWNYNKRYFFKNMIIKKFVNTPIECKITRPFIWDWSHFWNRDIDKSFPKKRKNRSVHYCCYQLKLNDEEVRTELFSFIFLLVGWYSQFRTIWFHRSRWRTWANDMLSDIRNNSGQTEFHTLGLSYLLHHLLLGQSILRQYLIGAINLGYFGTDSNVCYGFGTIYRRYVVLPSSPSSRCNLVS